MSFVLYMCEGFELQGLQRCVSASASLKLTNEVRANCHGVRSLYLGTATNELIQIDPFEFQGSPNSAAKVLGYWVKRVAGTTTTFNALYAYTGSTIQKFRITLSGSGTIFVQDQSSTTISQTNSTGVNDGGWHLIEFWYEDNTASAAWEIFLDGTSLDSGTGEDFLVGATDRFRFTVFTAGEYSCLDDIYFAAATTASERLGDCDIFALSGNLTTYGFFDASDGTTTGTNWITPVYATQGFETTNYAYITNTTANSLYFYGTNTPISTETINSVYVRVKAQTADISQWPTYDLVVYTDGQAETLLTQNNITSPTTAGGVWSSWYALSAPAGGWTWADLTALEGTITPDYGTGTGFEFRIYAIEVYATHSGAAATTGGDTLDAGVWPSVQQIPYNDSSYTSYNQTGQTERQPPDTIATQTNLTGSVADIDEDPDSPDGNWLTASGSSTLRVTFPTPTGAPETGAGKQNFRAWVRRTNESSASGTIYCNNVTVSGYSNIGGSSLTDCVDEDQNGFATSWLKPTTDNPSITQADYSTPGSTPNGTQTVGVYCGKFYISGDALDASGGTPTIQIDVYGTSGLIQTGSAQNVTTTGEWITQTFTMAGDAADIYIVCSITSNGGGPNKRTIAIDSIRWAWVFTATSPTYSLELYENGSQVGAVTPSTGSVTSTTGEILSLVWDATNLGTSDGSLVEAYLNQTGGSRNIEVGAIEWNVTYSGGALSGWVQSDGGGSYTGPSGMSGISSIVGMTTFIRTMYSGTGSTYTHSLVRGNSTDGTSELSLGNATSGWTDFFDITQSASIVPTASEYARVGFATAAGTDVEIRCSEVIAQILAIPTGAPALVFNPMHRMMPFLVR